MRGTIKSSFLTLTDLPINISLESNRQIDEGLTLETSIIESFTVANLPIYLVVDHLV